MLKNIQYKHLYIGLTLYLIILLYATTLFAGNATLSWDPPTTNADGTPLTDLAGYTAYYGTVTEDYSQSIDVGNVTTYQVSNLAEGLTYYFAVTAYDTSGNESEFSDKISKTIGTPNNPPELSVNPLLLEFTLIQGSVSRSQALSIDNTGGRTLSWTASSNSEWLLIDKKTGTAPDTINVSVGNIAFINEGTYSGSITISAEGALNSPTVIPVTLNIVLLKGTINVTANLEAATFTMSGPESYSGSGTNWTVTDAPIGKYFIIFGEVEGYIKPASDNQDLMTDGVINFSGVYKEEPQTITKKSIIVGAGPGSNNAGEVKVIHSDRTTGAVFTAHGYNYGAEVATGDIDGDGIEEIITAPGPGKYNQAEINIFDNSGNQLTDLSFMAYGYRYGAYIASGDFDGDGRDEIVTGTGAGPANPAEVKVFVYEPSTQNFIDSGIDLLAYYTTYGVRIAAGDVDGDGISEIITAPGPGKYNTGIIRIWKVDTSLGVGQWIASFYKEFTVESRYTYSVSVASGDVNGDGYDEIITGAGPHWKAFDTIKVFDEGGKIISEFRAYIVRRYGANVASGDIDGDGVAEIVAGAGPGSRNRGIIKIFDVNGTEKTRIKALQTRYGANVTVGNLGFE